MKYKHAAFICHAGEDKDTFVRELAGELRNIGLSVWYDEFTLRIGDSLSRKVNEGLKQSEYGIVVFSKAFFAKNWPRRELEGLVALERDGQKKILPVWFDVDREDILEHYPVLADLYAADASHGMSYVIEELLKVLEHRKKPDLKQSPGVSSPVQREGRHAIAGIRHAFHRVRKLAATPARISWRKLAGIIVVGIIAIAVTVAMCTPMRLPTADAPVLTFPDPNLEAAIREAIGIPDGPVYASDLRGLTSLAAVDRSIASLTGLQYCVDLVSLDLRENQISDIAPLSSLTNLTRLMLWDNQIDDISPLTSVTKLTELHLMWNQVSDIAPLANLTGLRELSLGANQISDISPLAALTNLTRLTLVSNQISDISPLAALTGLTVLSLDGNEISHISSLAGLTNLTQLSIVGNQISDIRPLGNVVSLAMLWLMSNQISNISSLADLTSLAVLDLANNQISDVSALVDNPGLGVGDELVLTNNPLSSDSLYTYIPQLQARGVSVDY